MPVRQNPAANADPPMQAESAHLWSVCKGNGRPVRLTEHPFARNAGITGNLSDSERLFQDPTFRLISSEKIWDRGVTLTSRLQSFETEILAEDSNFAGLAQLNRELVGKAEEIGSQSRTVLDRDSTEIPVYGEQEPTPETDSKPSDEKQRCPLFQLVLSSGRGELTGDVSRSGNVQPKVRLSVVLGTPFPWNQECRGCTAQLRLLGQPPWEVKCFKQGPAQPVDATLSNQLIHKCLP